MKETKIGSDHYLRVVLWNKKRNNLELNFDLEAQMLSEELSEFFHAPTLEDRLDAYCDFCFVSMGTMTKALAFNAKNGYQALIGVQKDTMPLLDYMESAKGVMQSVLKEELTRYNKAYDYDECIFEEFLKEALEIVIQANEAKPSERDDRGKVVKGINFKRPEDKLKTLIQRRCPDYV